MDFKKKYLKYKNKYLTLNKQIIKGGSDKIQISSENQEDVMEQLDDNWDDWETLADEEYNKNIQIKAKNNLSILVDKEKLINSDSMIGRIVRDNIWEKYTKNKDYYDEVDLSAYTYDTLKKIIYYIENGKWNYDTSFPYDQYKSDLSDEYFMNDIIDPRPYYIYGEEKQYLDPDFWLLPSEPFEKNNKLWEKKDLFDQKSVLLKFGQKELIVSGKKIENTFFEPLIEESELGNYTIKTIELSNFIKLESFEIINYYFVNGKWNYDTTIPYDNYKDPKTGKIRILDYEFQDPRPTWEGRKWNSNFFLLDYKPYTKNNTFWNNLKKKFDSILKSKYQNEYSIIRNLEGYVLDDRPLPDNQFFRRNIKDINKLKLKMEKDIEEKLTDYPIFEKEIYMKIFSKMLSQFKFILPMDYWNTLSFSEKEYYFHLTKFRSNSNKYHISQEQIVNLKKDPEASIFCKKKEYNATIGCIF